ncbi:telomerase protein component 1-like [Bufo gargarizans]|uniref:telomerase protein component 1-like n=1 Tax=Bufo gargarizans TaxID=30331 RepID=UPI001CF591B5|nr:telomerase protein component 1-like [Bufo gargarizans]XP_044131084.1 telomerase protein component 1-like [Bufo gargarizans]XP_044131085.1 telomerase protein component 1-like [Bufo gargarizans]
MPSSDFPLEKTGLRGTRQISQPRRRLALTLPGSDQLSTAIHSKMEFSAPTNELLSWEKGSLRPLMTTNSVLASGLELSPQSLLSSSLSSTSNSILDSGSFITSQSSLDNKSLSSSFSGLLSSPLASKSLLTTNSCLTSEGSCSVLTSNILLSPKYAVNSVSFLSAEMAVNLNSSSTPLDTSNIPLSAKKTDITVSPLPSDVSRKLNSTLIPNVETSNLSLHYSSNTVLPTTILQHESSKNIETKSTSHGRITSELPSTLVADQTKELELQDVTFLPVTFEQDEESSEISMSPTEAIMEHWPSQSSQASESEFITQEQVKPMQKEPAVIDIEKPDNLLKQKKMALISAVCCSLVNSPKFTDSSDTTRASIKDLCEDIAQFDPEFILKVALYTRQELNIRTTANFLLALSALFPSCRPHLRRYLCSSVQLPSDWMDVPRMYQSLAGKGDKLAPLPSCLRRALTLKFQQFSEYQLAKYNTRKQRGKHDSQKKKEKKTSNFSALKCGRNMRKLEGLCKLLDKQVEPASASAGKKTKDKFSMKSLIQRLHISKPVNHVMSLLGCRYPKDLNSFSRSGLEGPWQSHLSGQRMKLKQPETWERELSQKGNTGPVWEGLLDNRKVPFMALLRNLRNMIGAGIGEKHHREVTAYLSNQNAVIKSRLFPFRFLSAYKVIHDLECQLSRAEEPFPTNSALLQRIFRKEKKNIPQLSRKSFSRSELRACLAFPVIHRLLKRQKEALRKARTIKFNEDIVARYKKSLEEAIRISARHNIPPIPGRTVILMCVDSSMYASCHGAKELAVSSYEPFERREPPSLMDVGLLLSLMVMDTAENVELILYNQNHYAKVDHSSCPLLERVSEVKQQAEKMQNHTVLPCEGRNPLAEYLSELLMKRTKVDTLLVFGEGPLNEEFKTVLKHYRRVVNADCLCVTVLPNGFQSEDSLDQCNDVTLCGFTEQVLKYVSERGTSRLLDHVEKVNERFNIPEDPENIKKRRVAVSGLLTSIPKQKWRSVRVFISSTFRDMHSERDVLIGQVMPQLRQRAACHFLSLEEVDLRWGITEEETKKDRQLSLCLSEVVRSQIFIGILGERYGHVPITYSVPLMPEYQWIQSYPPGRSVTELESMQFLQSCKTNKSGHPKAFFYFRNPEVIRSVPSHWLSDFVSESQEAEKRMLDLKKRVVKHPAARSYRYSCQWGGEHDGKPHLTELEDFGARVLNDVWQVIERDYLKEESNVSEDEEDQLTQEGFQEWHERHSFARSKQVMQVCEQILEKRRASPSSGRVFLVVGEPSQGKTVFMADLVKELRLVSSASVVYHFTGANRRSKDVETMLKSFCKQLNKRLQRESKSLNSYRDALAEFQALLLLIPHSLKRNDTLTILVDGADVLCGCAGELTSDWIPDFLPQRVNMVLSVTEGSSLCGTLRKCKGITVIPLGRLEPSERAELVRGKLAVYGKKLEESAFNNQMRLLMIKKGTRDPLYLTLACEELRANAVFEKLSEDIQKLPASLPQLLQKRLNTLEEEHGTDNVTVALTAICISQKGLLERDLLRILSSLQWVKSIYTASWSEMLAAATHTDSLPMATFSLLLGGLRSVLGLWSHNLTSEPRLHLSSCLLREAVEKRYFGKPEVVSAVHLLMAAYFWTVSSPKDPDSSPVLHAECLSELSHHLLCGMQFHTLGQLLVHLPFLRAHASLGLLPHLCQVYSNYGIALSKRPSSWEHMETDPSAPEPPVRVFREFIERSLHILSQNPSLFYQLALNEPHCSPVCIQAQEILAEWSSESQFITVWENKPKSVNFCSSKSLDVPSTPGCVGLSCKGNFAVVGTSDGSLHILHTDSGEEIRTLYSGCDGVSCCAFISDTLLCVGSYDGTLEIWNITDGCRINRIEAHRRQVTGCCVSADRRQMLTCSLDSDVKIWDTSRCTLTSSSSFPSPLNCAAFHPNRHMASVGSWDGKVFVVQLDNWNRSAVLCGSSSVKTVSFSLDGSVVVSGSLDGWVSLWSWEAQVLLSRFRAHSGYTLTSNFLQHGEYLLTGGEDGKVQVSSGGLGRLHAHGCVKTALSPALSVAISPNRQMFAVGYHSDSVYIYKVDNGELVSQCPFENVAVDSLVWLSDNTLITGSSDSLIRVWDVSPEQSSCRLTLCGHQRSVQALALSCQFLASASEDVSICLWSVDNLLVANPSVSPVSVLRSHTAAVTCCAFSPGGNLLATGGKDRSLLCWDVSVKPPVLAHTLLSCHKDWITCCSWTDDSMLVSSSGDGSVCLWDIQNEKQLLTFAGHLSAVSSALCMGERVITSGRDGFLKVWSLTGTEIASIPTHHSQINQSTAYWEPEHSRDDTNLVVYTAGSDAMVLKWSPLQMEQIQTLNGHGAAVVSSVADPQLQVTVTAGQDGSIRLWGAPCRDDSLLATSHKGMITAVAWSPDGELVVSGGECGDLIVWRQHKALLTLQCGELCISSIIFTTKRSFCCVSSDLTVSRWLLFPCKEGALRGKKAYSVAIESLVLSAVLTTSQKVQLHMLSGKDFLLDPKTGSLQNVDDDNASLPDSHVHPPQEMLHPGSMITASHPHFGVGDSVGALWLKTSQTSSPSTADMWEKKQIHAAAVSCLSVTDNLVITASVDHSVKIWKRSPFTQVGVFYCEGAVTCLSPCPIPERDTSSVLCQIACGDQYGKLYMLTCVTA